MVFRRVAKPYDNPVVPSHHVVDWDDQPSRFKIYQGVTRLPLALNIAANVGTLASTIEQSRRRYMATGLNYEQLSTLLLLSNGLLRRKLDINWSQDNLERTVSSASSYGRPAASGGGMYPFELYFING